MKRIALMFSLGLGLGALALVPHEGLAQQAKVKAGKGEKVCRVKMQYSGEVKTWVCKKEEPCCVWHEINYVKCGSVALKCL